MVARAGAQGVRGPGGGAAYAGGTWVILAWLILRAASRASLAGPFSTRAVHPSHGAWPAGVTCTGLHTGPKSGYLGRRDRRAPGRVCRPNFA